MANLLLGAHPIMAGKMAIMLAAQEIEHVGPSALFWNDPPPSIPLDERVEINTRQVEKVSEVVRDLPDADPFNFVGDYLPPVDDPAVLNYFFAVTLQQFSFWETRDGKYTKPLIAMIDGRELKGSTYLYYAYTRKLDADPEFFTPEHQAVVTRNEMLDLFHADDGSDPMPALELHVSQANQYGRDMLAMGVTPEELVSQAKKSTTPLKAFIEMLDHIGGYKEDPVRKK